jgi:UDP-N-acetylmuramoylalanine--D-glutamate ligase
MNYYKNDMQRYFDDKAEIFKHQTVKDFLIISKQAEQEISKRYNKNLLHRSGIVFANENKIKNIKTNLIGAHNQTNIALAYEVFKIFKLKTKDIKTIIKNFKPEPGRLECIGKIKNINYYNDNNATTPDATIAALKALDKNKKNIILICGGADKELKFEKMLEIIKKTAKAVIFFKGTATDKILNLIPKDFPNYIVVDSMKSAVQEAQKFAKKGDIILLSPGAASFGVFKNEYDRNDQFIKYVKK